MGILNTITHQLSKNKGKATEQYEKNKHKVAPLVGKATDQVDKVTKGKSAGITSKIDEAARKVTGASTTSGTDPRPVEPAKGSDTP